MSTIITTDTTAIHQYDPTVSTQTYSQSLDDAKIIAAANQVLLNKVLEQLDRIEETQGLDLQKVTNRESMKIGMAVMRKVRELVASIRQPSPSIYIEVDALNEGLDKIERVLKQEGENVKRS